MKVGNINWSINEIFFFVQGKGEMTTYWLVGENSQGESEISDKNVENELGVDTCTENHDEGIDDGDEIASPTRVTFHVSDHDSDATTVDNVINHAG